MSANKYGLRDLLTTYAASHDEKDYEEMREYNTRFYAALCKALDTSVVEVVTVTGQLIRTTIGESNRRVLYLHFQSTVRSYLALATPYSGYLEAGLLFKAIENLGPEGEGLQAIEKALMEHASTLRALHLDSMEALFTILYGAVTAQVTRDDLLHHGFDPQQLPDIDY